MSTTPAPDFPATRARLVLPLRLVLGWIFVGAAWRRLVLAPQKHDMGHEAWLGHKINTFQPHASWPVHDLLGWLVTEPGWLDAFTWVFTGAELLVGLLLFAGLFTRLAGLGVIGLGAGLMHTSGWLGPTCLSEWHTASLLVLGGILLAMVGRDDLSLDARIERRWPRVTASAAWRGCVGASGADAFTANRRRMVAISLAALVYVMGTNQAFHGGVWGPLHNHATRPGFEVGAPSLSQGEELRFRLYRDRGPETWGAHVVEIRLVDTDGSTLHVWQREDLVTLDPAQIHNRHVNEVRPGPHALEAPLGSLADITLPLPRDLDAADLEGAHLEIEEVGGLLFNSPAASAAIDAAV